MTDFDWNPETYLAQMLEEIPGYEELEAAVAAATREFDPRTVLELGCGNGSLLFHMAGWAPAHLEGIDAYDVEPLQLPDVLGGRPVVVFGKWRGDAIQGAAEGLIAWISGNHSGVVGLPLFETRALLKAAGFPVG